MSLEEYAKAFNRALDEAFERELKDKVYFVCENPRRCGVITNIGNE